MRDNIEVEIFESIGEVSVRYPESGMTKQVVVKYDSQENRCDLLDPRENVVVSGFDEEIFISVGGMNV